MDRLCTEVVGYPVFTRLCMGELKHRFVLLQDGAAAIIVNDKGQILLQNRSDRDEWGLPGGCQELGETFEDVIIREVKEETNLDVREEDLKLIKIVSGMSRMYYYVEIKNITKLDVSSDVSREINQFLDDYYDRYTGLYLKSKDFIKKINKMNS